MARIFGAPVMEPPGKQALNTSAGLLEFSSSPLTVLIRHVLKALGRVRKGNGLIEVELDRLDNKIQVGSLDKVLEDLNKYNYLRFPDGRKLEISQAL